MESSDLEEVPLSEQDKGHIAEAWLGQIHAVPGEGEPNIATMLETGLFAVIVNQVLLVHGFEPGTAVFEWRGDGQLTVVGRRLPAGRVSDSPGLK
jgi:hypothetical protein